MPTQNELSENDDFTFMGQVNSAQFWLSTAALGLIGESSWLELSETWQILKVKIGGNFELFFWKFDFWKNNIRQIIEFYFRIF